MEGQEKVPRIDNIDQYIDTCTEAVIPLLRELRTFIVEALPGASEGMRYGAPVFFNAHGVPVIYLFGSKGHVNFGFLKSAELSDPDNILRGSGKPSKHLKIFPGKPIDRALLRTFVRQCKKLK